MGSAICAGVLALIAFVAYTRWQKEKEAENKSRAALWMVLSLVCGVGAVLNLIVVVFGEGL